MESESESQTEKDTQNNLFQKLTGNRWVWVAVLVVFLGSAAFVIAQSVQQSAELETQIEEAEDQLSLSTELIDKADDLESSLLSCIDVSTTRIQQLESFKSSLSVISSEYQNMYHAGIGNVNVDSYIDALNNVAAVTSVLDGQDLGACDEK